MITSIVNHRHHNHRHHHAHSAARHGFTLLELSVILVILLLIAAILFPIFARRQRYPGPHGPNCMTNLKQVSLGIIQYTQDYNERFPPNLGGGAPTGVGGRAPTSDGAPTGVGGRAPTSATPANMLPKARFQVALESGAIGNYQTWMDLIYPYVKNTQILVCLNEDRKFSPYPSYGYSVALGGYGSARSLLGKDKKRFHPARLEEIERPAEVIMFTDYNAPEAYRMTPDALQRHAAMPTSTVVCPHKNGGYIAYADGHVKWSQREKLARFATGTTACNLKKPDPNSQYCEKVFNPFLP